MSSTNKTTHYELPQFVDNDIFNPLVDDNDAYDKIDTALYNIANAEADDASEIVNVKSRMTSAEGAIDAIKTQNGSSVLTTTAQTLSGAINEVNSEADALAGRMDIIEDDINNASTGLKVKVSTAENDIDALETRADALETQNGSEVLETTAQTLSGAINEIVSNAPYVTPEMYGAVGDGITDDSQAFIDCATAVGEGGVITLASNKKYLVGVTLGAVSIIGNGATLVTKADATNGNYAIKFVTDTKIPTLIKDFKVDGGGTNSTNGLNGLYFSGIRKGFVVNIVVDNVGEYGIYVNDGYNVTFNNIIIRKTVDENDVALSGYGIYVPASDMTFNHVVIINFLVSIYDRGINLYDGIHAWIATAVNDTIRANAIAVDFNNQGIFNNVYIDSIPVGFLFNDYITGCIINNVHWLLYGECDYILLKNNTSSSNKLNNAVVNNIYLQGSSEPTQNYKIFENSSPVIANVVPKFLDVDKTYGSVPHTINAKAHFTKEIIRSIGEYIFVEFNIVADDTMTTSETLVDLTTTPLRNAHYVTCFVNGVATQMYVKSSFAVPQNLSANDEIIVRATIPRI